MLFVFILKLQILPLMLNSMSTKLFISRIFNVKNMDDIIGRDYPKKVIPLINAAKRSLKIVVFDWRWYPNDPANPAQLFNASIVNAVARGLSVSCISNSADIVKILSSVGCKTRKPISQHLLHVKMIIIDDEILVIGSHNFSQNAFCANFEASVAVSGSEKIVNFVKFFDALWQL
jgi:phosphatidylserine/phosphatidylglycerophosphate/cardiolipin synthase-like enzyme